jgi:hypothetical protein
MCDDYGMPPLAQIFIYVKSLPTKVCLSFFAFTLTIYIALIAFQAAILTLVIPQEFTLHYFYLNVNSPNLSSMFFNHFMHNPWSISHMTENILAFLFLSVMLFIAAAIVLPASGYSLPKHFFPAIFLVYAAGLPFALSGISIWAGRIFGKMLVSGFSGFNFALLGLLFFLMLFWGYTRILKEQPANPLSPYKLLFGAIFMIGLVIAAIMLDLKNPNVCIFAHLGGFLLGLLIPAMVGIVLMSESMKQKVGFSLFLIAVLVACAGFWVVL